MANFQNEFTYKKYAEQGKEEEFDRLFDDAVGNVKSEVLGKRFPLYINGKEIYAGEELIENSPIDGTLVGRFQKGTREHAKDAIASARTAFSSWAGMDYRERVKIFRNATEIFRKHKFALAAILSIENGKTRHESVGEVDEAIDLINYYATEIERNRGFVRRSKLEASEAKAYEKFKSAHIGFQGALSGEERITVAMKPYGVFGVIAPFNFPVSISTGMCVGALITGNTVVFKPSSTDNMTMLTGLEIYRFLKEAGIPDGVMNFVTGPGSEVGDELAANEGVSGIAFTGSRAVGMGMIKNSYGLGMQKIFIVEMGGKNPAIVTKHANLDDAVTGIAGSAFGFSAQKCSACSRVYVQESVKEEFVSKLIDKLRSMKIGNPLNKDVFIGPLISAKALERYKAAVNEARSAGSVLYGGNAVSAGLNGAYVEPTLVDIEHSHKLVHEELFVPILMIDTFKKFDEAVRKANDTEYGLTAGLYSKSRKEINEFVRGIEAGVIYINRRAGATTGAVVGFHPFVGWKGSGLTGKGTGSRLYLTQFLREQSQAIVK